MSLKRALEVLDRTMKDIRSNQNLFGGAMILLADDFRQTLPVIPRSRAADVNHKYASCVTKRSICCSVLQATVRHWQWKILNWPFHRNDFVPTLVPTRCLHLYNNKRRADFLGLPTHWSKLRKSLVDSPLSLFIHAPEQKSLLTLV